jgi:predicted O-methyltransferase YrrM
MNFLKKISVRLNTIPAAEKIFTHTTHEERLLLAKLARKSVGNGLEIGSYLGASSSYIASSMGSSNRKLYCVDTWKNDAMTEGQRDTFDEFKKNVRNWLDKIVICQGTSVEVSKSIDKTFGFVFFDADHSYEGIKSDWESWKDKINKGAIICFHDYGWAEGVQKVVKEDIKPIAKFEGSLPNLYWAVI